MMDKWLIRKVITNEPLASASTNATLKLNIEFESKYLLIHDR